MPPLATNLLALLTYALACLYLLRLVNSEKTSTKTAFLGITVTAISLHGAGIYQLMAAGTSVDLGIHKMTSLIALIVNLLILISSWRKPLHNLFVFVLPLAILCIALSVLVNRPPQLLSAPPGVTIHILLSIVAYSILCITVLQSLLWKWQNQRLKSSRLNGAIRLLPPLQTMELLIFELLWAGVILLALGIGAGFLYLDNIFTQHLTHKTVLSIFAWLIFAGLLWGRHTLGWRGNIAVRWLLTGFCLLMLAYFGSKLALEVIIKS